MLLAAKVNQIDKFNNHFLLSDFVIFVSSLKVDQVVDLTKKLIEEKKSVVISLWSTGVYDACAQCCGEICPFVCE